MGSELNGPGITAGGAVGLDVVSFAGTLELGGSSGEDRSGESLESMLALVVVYSVSN